MDKDHLILVDGYWYYQRRVPADISHLVKKKFLRKSTKQKNKSDARIIARRFDSEAENYWKALAEGKDDETAADKFSSAVKRARALGVSYKTINEIREDNIHELVSRLQLLEQKGLVTDTQAVSAVLGGVDKPRFQLDQIMDVYIKLSREALRKKAPDQRKRWQQPRERAIRNLIAVIGNKDITALTRNDALDFRDYLMDRIEAEEIVPASANKQISQVNTIINTVDEAHRLGIDKPFAGTRLDDSDPNKRPPFAPEWVQNVILKKGALDGLNLEARAVVFVMCWTGMRPSEIANIQPENIVLDAPIPFLRVKHTSDRRIKNNASIREMPLVSGALEAMQKFPNGFPTYCGKTDGMSNTINKYFRENNLLPPPDPDFELPHSLYSLRHTFQDKLTDLDLIDRKQSQLMGHKFQRSRYGRGASLEDRRDVLQEIAFTSPGI